MKKLEEDNNIAEQLKKYPLGNLYEMFGIDLLEREEGYDDFEIDDEDKEFFTGWRR